MPAELPQCAYPGCRARYDETLDGSYGSRPVLGRLTGWRWLDSDGPEDPEVPAHDHTLGPGGGPCPACRGQERLHTCELALSACHGCAGRSGRHSCGLAGLQDMLRLPGPRGRRR